MPAMEQKIKYFCTRCRYKFGFKPTSNRALVCPYCGKPDKIVEDRFSAQDFVDSSDNSEKFFTIGR